MFIWLGNEKIPQVAGMGTLNIYMNQFPFDEYRSIQDYEKSLLQTYQVVVFNSVYSLRYWETFVHDWKKHLLANRLEVPQRALLYPPVAQISSTLSNLRDDKLINILMLGRFFEGRQSKRQADALRVFKKLKDALRVFKKLKRRFLEEPSKLLLPEPQLWLVGGQQPGHLHFTEKIQRQAKQIGDVHIIVDATPDQLHAIMANASVVWSMTGFGGEEDDPADSEHFGMACTEAMSTGAYPVLLNRGGLPEIICNDIQQIDDGTCTPLVGALASNDDEFVTHTLDFLLDESGQKSKWREASKSRASKFSAEMFVKRFMNIVHKGLFVPFWAQLRSIMRNNQEMVMLPRQATPYVAVIVEMRIDVVLPTVIRNQMAMLGCSWRLHIFLSKRNEAWLRSSLSDFENVEYTVLEQSDLNDSSYNNLLKQEWFWKQLGHGTEYALIFQLDCVMLKPGIEHFFIYDYIGAPWTSDNDIYFGINEAKVKIPPLNRSQRVGNGGFSLRKVSAMLHAILAYGKNTTDDEQEDVFFVRWLPRLGYTVAPLRAAATFSSEVPVSDASMPADGPLALHQTWLYMDNERIERLLSMLKQRHINKMVANRSRCQNDGIESIGRRPVT
jgi:glycosyltransferase involved in cell wall biosynthesis